jgi:mannose/fructose/N-acetylgalactosamine-specific phosphotransferase system component IIC
MEIVLVTLIGGLLALDGTSVGQFMLSRPLVAGTLLGWMLGEPALGVTVGAILELYLLVSFPTGGSRFPEGATATVVAVASAAGSTTPGALPLALAVGLVWGQLGGVTITALRHANSRLVPEPSRPPRGPADVTLAHGIALLLDFARGAALTFSGVLLGRAVVSGFGVGWHLAPPASVALLLVGGSVSAGILLRDLGGFRRRRTLLVAGMALGILGARLL